MVTQKKELTLYTEKKINIELIPGRDFHQMYLYMAGVYEKNITQFLLKEIPNYDVFIDVGSYLGYYSLIANSIKPNMKVFAFEPQKEAYEALLRNMANNSCENIEAHCIALGNYSKSTVLNIHVFPEQSTLLSIINSKSKQEAIFLRKADELVDIKEQKIIIKIDTEGYEFEVLKGMENLLNNNKCLLLFEFNPLIYNKNFEKNYAQEQIEKLKNKGFELCKINNRGNKDAFVFKHEDLKQQYLMAKTDYSKS